jgi:hypothetical protein
VHFIVEYYSIVNRWKTALSASIEAAHCGFSQLHLKDREMKPDVARALLALATGAFAIGTTEFTPWACCP